MYDKNHFIIFNLLYINLALVDEKAKHTITEKQHKTIKVRFIRNVSSIIFDIVGNFIFKLSINYIKY